VICTWLLRLQIKRYSVSLSFSDEWEIINSASKLCYLTAQPLHSCQCDAPVVVRVDAVMAAASFTSTRSDCIAVFEACFRRVQSHWVTCVAVLHCQHPTSCCCCCCDIVARRPVTMRNADHAHRESLATKHPFCYLALLSSSIDLLYFACQLTRNVFTGIIFIIKVRSSVSKRRTQ